MANNLYELHENFFYWEFFPQVCDVTTVAATWDEVKEKFGFESIFFSWPKQPDQITANKIDLI